MVEGSGNKIAMVMGITKVAALAYLMFNLYSPPCVAALGAMSSEMKSRRLSYFCFLKQQGGGTDCYNFQKTLMHFQSKIR